MVARPLGRLRKGREFDTAYAEGTVTNGPLFVVRVRANDLDHPRWGFAVGKRLTPKAVTRNRVKRRLREAVRLGEFGQSEGLDIVVTARAASVTATFPELSASLNEQVARAIRPLRLTRGV